MKITDISVKRTTIPVVIFIILALAGIYSYTLLNKEFAPSIEIPINTIMTIYPGAAPSEVESSVSTKIEEAVSAIEGVDKLTVYSFESLSVVMIQYKDNVDADLALQECERRVNSIKENLPENCRESRFMKFDLNMFPVMNIAVNSGIPDKEFFDIVDKEIKTRFQQIEGIANVEILGGNEREIEVKVNARKLEQYGISLMQVQQVLAASNLDFPAGKIKGEESKYIVRLAGKFENLDEIRNLTIGASREGTPVKLQDIASVVDGVKESSKLARINGNPAIGISIQKQTDGNAVNISHAVLKVIADFEKQYENRNLKFTIASDNADFTEKAVDNVMIDLVFAIILVSVTMLLFLHTFRNLVFILVSIPTSVISTFVFFRLFGFSLNLLTLLALSIVIGAIVDDAIVVLENIYRHLEMGKSRWQASLDACREIGMTVTSITMVLIAVFLPIGITSGLTGQILKSFSITIVVSILLSLLVSFTLVPLLTSRFGKLKQFDKSKLFDRFLLRIERIINQIRMLILAGLRKTLAYRTTTIFAAIFLLIGSFLLIAGGFIQTEFLDAGDRGEFVLSMELDRKATLEQTNAWCLNVEKKLLDYPEVDIVYTKVGSKSNTMFALETPYSAEFMIKMVPYNKRNVSSSIFAQQLRKDMLSTFAGPVFNIVQVNVLGTNTKPVQVFVRSTNLDSAIVYSRIVTDAIRSIPGTTDVVSSIENGDKEFVIRFDREKLARLGLTIGEIGAQMHLAYDGNRDLKFSEGSKEYDIFVSLDEFDRHSKSDVENISFTNRAGQLVKLSQVAAISEGESPSGLTRYKKLPSVSITGNLVGKTVGTFGEEIKAKLAQTSMPQGVDIVYAGDLEQQSKSFSSLLMALLASVILMYLIMVALYDSYMYPLVVMLSLPLALIGALLALALAGKTLSLFSIMGIIMLMGLVAKNAILVVDFANKLQEEGRNVIVAITEATNVRFRPIFMTNLALIVGLMPIAFAAGPGAEWKSSLGWVLIGGLISSMFLSLIIVPVIYVMIDNLTKRVKSRFRHS
ncbi:MAG TPA: efflux RND transporter permease subunit [Bacteroidales bacterium]|nr:efflux RND transporter permease subunit [Bacteroidales bacterium]